MLEDRRGGHVAFGVRERTQFLPNLPAEREPHVTAQFISDGRSPIGHRSLENGRGTKVNHFNVPYREPNRPLSVSRKVGGIPIIPTVGRVAARNRCAVYAGDCNGQNPK